MKENNSKKSMTPLGGFLSSVVMATGFLFVSYYLIIGKGNFDSVKKVDDQEGVMQVFNDNFNNITYYDGADKEFDVKAQRVSVYITSKGIVKEMDLEEYVKGVVSSEMPINFNLEALKAQAIAARTYTVAHYLSSGCSKAHGADLCDTIHCQVYTDKNDKIKSWGNSGSSNWNKIEQAVNETKGMVLTYNNTLVKGAYYFSTSGGKTENVEDVFAAALPYLRSVDSPGESVAPRYKSQCSFTYNEFVSTINRNYGSANLTKINLKDRVVITSRTDGGSVKNIKVGDVTISGTNFRNMFNLNSANFTLNIDEKNNKVNVDCLGFGHGVGMSQWGANIMAAQGKNFKEILLHYYTGVDINNLK